MKNRIINILRWSEKYTKTDMVYLASGNFWLSGSRILSVGNGMLLTLAFANLLTPDVFGTYKYILATAGFIGSFALGGLGGAIGHSVAQGNSNVVPGAFRVSILWSTPASCVALAISIYYFIQGNAILGTGLALIAFTNLFGNSFGLYKNVILGRGDFKTYALYNIPNTLITSVAMLTTVFLTKNISIIIAAYFVSNFFTGWLIYTMTAKKYGIKRDDGCLQETVTYGKHLSLMGFISQVSSNVDQLLLWHFAGPVQLAMYTFALAPIREIRNFSETVHPLIFPKYVTKTVSEIKQTMRMRVFQLGSVSLLVALVYILIAPLFFHLVFPQYTGAIILSQILAIALIFQPKGIIETVLYSQGNTKLRYTTTLVTNGSKVVAWAILIPLYGVVGAVAGIILGDIVSALILWWAYKKIK